MKKCKLVTISTVAASLLLFSAIGYAHEVNYETFSYGTDGDTGGSGTADFDVDYSPNSYAWAMANIEGSETDTWAEADAYVAKKMYITDYDPNEDPTLTARAVGVAWAEVWTYGDTASSEYYAEGEATCWATGCGLSESCYANAYVIDPDEGDYDLDIFSEDTDVSYTGATIYYGNFCASYAYALSTSGEVECDVECMPASSVSVRED